MISVVGLVEGESGMGAALAATADRDSRLRPVASFCGRERYSVPPRAGWLALTGAEAVSVMMNGRRNTTTRERDKKETEWGCRKLEGLTIETFQRWQGRVSKLSSHRVAAFLPETPPKIITYTLSISGQWASSSSQQFVLMSTIQVYNDLFTTSSLPTYDFRLVHEC